MVISNLIYDLIIAIKCINLTKICVQNSNNDNNNNNNNNTSQYVITNLSIVAIIEQYNIFNCITVIHFIILKVSHYTKQ